jgi:hypothetical protein
MLFLKLLSIYLRFTGTLAHRAVWAPVGQLQGGMAVLPARCVSLDTSSPVPGSWSARSVRWVPTTLCWALTLPPHVNCALRARLRRVLASRAFLALPGPIALVQGRAPANFVLRVPTALP